MEKQKRFHVDGQALYFFMPKEVDHHVAQNLCRELDMLVESYAVSELILDFSQTEFMDSSGIGVVIGRSKTMQFRGGKIGAQNMSRRVAAIFQSAGLQKIVKVREV